MAVRNTARVLIVDNGAVNLDALGAMLAARQCALVRTTSGHDALLQSAGDDVAAIVLDIRMPDIDGLELARLITQRAQSRHVPILFLTSNPLDVPDMLKGYDAGAVDYLVKPVNPAILSAKIGVFVDLLKSVGEARDEAERQGRVKEEFLATLSHELRTPMNVILGGLEVLASGKPIRDRESTLALIQRNARLQARLIDDLLDMNRLMSGNAGMVVASVDMGAALRASADALRPVAEARGVRVLDHVEAGSLEVLADPRFLQQILSNLLHNAIKFTPEGGRVDAHAERAGTDVVLTVRDNGRGISQTFLPHVFERFRQEDSSTTRDTFGLGLGLSIAKHLTEAHGGTITAHSDGIGRGATFSVRFPFADARRAMIAAEPHAGSGVRVLEQ